MFSYIPLHVLFMCPCILLYIFGSHVLHCHSQIVLMGEIMEVNESATSVTYKIDDRTGPWVDVRRWLEQVCRSSTCTWALPSPPSTHTLSPSILHAHTFSLVYTHILCLPPPLPPHLTHSLSSSYSCTFSLLPGYSSQPAGSCLMSRGNVCKSRGTLAIIQQAEEYDGLPRSTRGGF